MESSQTQETPKKRVVIGIKGDHFSQAFLLAWTQSFHALITTNRYELMISPGKQSLLQTLGLDVRRGKDQKPLNGDHYDVYVSIESGILFSPNHLIELIECTNFHPVVSGYYLSEDKHFDVIKDWNKSYFAENGTFQFMEPKDTDEVLQKFKNEIEAGKEAIARKQEPTPISDPQFMKVSSVGLGFFACRKDVLDDMKYPYVNRDLQRMKGKDVEILHMCTEEMAFCKNIEDAGYDIMLNTRLRVGNEKTTVL